MTTVPTLQPPTVAEQAEAAQQGDGNEAHALLEAEHVDQQQTAAMAQQGDGNEAQAADAAHEGGFDNVNNADTSNEQTGGNNAQSTVEPQLFGKDKYPSAGANGCVSVREVSKHYCENMGVDQSDKCADTSTECNHLYECSVCKSGSATKEPDDISNCMECKEGFVLEDAGFLDCTGSCRPLDEGEEPPQTTVRPTTAANALVDLDEYTVPVDEDGNPTACKWVDFTADDVAKWKESGPLVIMVTTVVNKPGTEKQVLQNAAAATWAALAPDVITVVAVDSDDQESPENLPRILCPANSFGTPFVANLFGEAERLASATGATFAGYSNGDIAMDDTLISVLDFIERKRGKEGFPLGHNGTKVAVLGKRLNIDSALDNIDELTVLREINGTIKRREMMRAQLMRMSRKLRNQWMSDMAEDFFFFEPGSIDWSKIPNYVIGRVGWDSFLTQYLLDRTGDVDVLDASKIIHAAHLTGNDGNAAGWNTRRPDKQWNYCALHRTCGGSTVDAVQTMCNECFRCKLGGLHQTAHRLSILAKTPPNEYYNYQVEPRIVTPQPRSATRKMAVASLLRNRIGLSHMQSFVKNVDPEKKECAVETLADGRHVYDPNCCSIMGGASIDYELGMRYQVRAEWPYGGWYQNWKS